jgi:hypothetical protein
MKALLPAMRWGQEKLDVFCASAVQSGFHGRKTLVS